jgi:DNA-binding CsgD family transcriptional regulator
MPKGVSTPGFLLMDAALSPIAWNVEAAQILTFPNYPAPMKRLSGLLSDRIKSDLLDPQSGAALEFVREFKSGRRRYMCHTFRLDGQVSQIGLSLALILERRSSGAAVLSQISKRFNLTEREQETVELLFQGLTSKEIAVRMGISPNTVKAFVRIVMVKMGVSTRSGIVGRIVGMQI